MPKKAFWLRLIAPTLVASVLLGHTALAAPKFSAGTSLDGVIAYQDDADSAQFFYLPGRIDTDLGVNLKSFKATYWGVGPALMGQTSNGDQVSIVGAILAGNANIDITGTQRSAIIAELQKVYGVANPKLLPIPLTNVKVVPILDSQTLAMGDKGVSINFPSTYIFGTDMVYSIGTGNSLFAEVVATRQSGSEITPNPTFGVSIIGDAEFVGDPWRVHIKCDLKQVWSEVRSRVSASVSLGWFRIGSADYSDIQQSLDRSHACIFDQKEGSMANDKYGRQIFEMMKKVFEEINKAMNDQDGFFKFEPNPHAGDPGGGGAASWLPWSVSINAGRSSASFTQSFIWEDTVSYTGRLTYTIPTSMILAVNCSSATKKNFVDIGDSSESCITQQKVDKFNERMKCEAKEKRPKLIEAADRLATGQINEAQYTALLRLYNKISFCDDSVSVASERVNVFKNAGFTTAYTRKVPEEMLRSLEAKAIENVKPIVRPKTKH